MPGDDEIAREYRKRLFQRATELQAGGLPQQEAMRTAELEFRISEWPEDWGDSLHVLLYGDFDPPDDNLEYPTLGISVESARRTDTFIRNALCVLGAKINVRDRSLYECFLVKPEKNRLYAIRNAINHGDIDSDDVRELIRVQSKFRRLKLMVFGMLGQIIPFEYPLDSGAR